MNQFKTLLEAAGYAATLSTGWDFAMSNDERYSRESLQCIAEVHDSENPADEDSFYVVSLFGSIGFCEDGEDIDWLFLSHTGADEELPETFQSAPQSGYCTECGSVLSPNARFCGKFGARLS
jgi:hypothetical protein